MAVHKSTFKARRPVPQGQNTDMPYSELYDLGKFPQKGLDDAHCSKDWKRFLLYSKDMLPLEGIRQLQVGQWCLLDAGRGNFFEADLSPGLDRVQVSPTRAVRQGLPSPHRAVFHRHCNATLSIRSRTTNSMVFSLYACAVSVTKQHCRGSLTYTLIRVNTVQQCSACPNST